MGKNRDKELERFAKQKAEELTDEELAKRYAEMLKKNGETRPEIEKFEKHEQTG